jgi:hypothetical protein
MQLPRRTFLHLAAGAAALPTVSRIASAQAYRSGHENPARLLTWRGLGNPPAKERNKLKGSAR